MGHQPTAQKKAKAEQTDIRDLLSFRLTRLAEVSDAIGQRWLLREYSLRLLEWRIIGLVAALKPARFAQLVVILNTDKGQLSRTITALRMRGLIGISSDPEDKRGRLIHLTDQGLILYEQILPGAVSRNQDMVRNLSKTEIATLFHLLNKLQPIMDARSEHENEQHQNEEEPK